MESLKIAAVQKDIIWEDIRQNLSRTEEKIQMAKDCDIIVLPEMFTTGFSMNTAELAEKMDGSTISWMLDQAQKHEAVITGSIIVKESNSFYNRMLWVTPQGEIEYYDKRHLFSYGKEHESYTAGKEVKIVDYKGWRFCLSVCYDLRFPVWLRNTSDYDCLLVIASWPETRIYHWDSLLQARAIENLSYVVAVNRVGTDGSNLNYTGSSRILDPMGKLVTSSVNEEVILKSVLTKSNLLEIRNKFNFLNDKDSFEIAT